MFRRRRSTQEVGDTTSSEPPSQSEGPSGAAADDPRAEKPAECRSAASSTPFVSALPLPPRPTRGARWGGILTDWFSSSNRHFKSRREVASSTTLQLLIYFNIYFSGLWAVAWVLLFQWKVSVWDAEIFVMIVVPVMYFIWLVLEPLRLALGYLGNLYERLAWLGARALLAWRTRASKALVATFCLRLQSFQQSAASPAGARRAVPRVGCRLHAEAATVIGPKCSAIAAAVPAVEIVITERPFIVLTVAPQLVVHLFIAAGQSAMGWFTLQIELVFSYSFVVLYLVEIFVAWRASRRFITKAAGEFQLQRADGPADE